MIRSVENSNSPAQAVARPAVRLSQLASIGRKVDPGDPAVARQAAEQLVSQLFFAPMLAEMRQLPFGKDFGNGGRGEEVFGEQLDQRLADRAAASDSSGLVAHLARKLQSRGRTSNHSSTGAAQESVA